jgi:RNA polymerase sigma-70 factor (ECF subfamily)
MPLSILRHRRLATLPAPGDHAGFGAFFRCYEPAVMAYLRRRVASPEAAADLTMETFAAALLAINEERARPQDPVAWLFGIARNKLVDAYRTGAAEDRARQRLGMPPIAVTDEDLERIDNLVEEGAVLALLESLPAEQREAVRARVIDESSYDEIATELGTSAMVIRQRVSRGLRTLRTESEGML